MNFYYSLDKLPNVRIMSFFSPKGEWSHFVRKTDEYIIYIIKSGNLYIEEDGIQMELESGDCVFLEPGKLHNGYKKACCEYYYLHFDGIDIYPENSEEGKILKSLLKNSFNKDGRYPSYKSTYGILPKTYNIADMDARLHLFSILDDYNSFKHYHYETRGMYDTLKCTEVLTEITLNYIGHPPTHADNQKLVYKLKNYLNNNYQTKITGDILENALHTNFDYMNRVFKKTTGNTVFDYLKGIRIRHAKQLLSLTNMKCYEVAFATGFSNEYYFSKIFKKETGMSPQEYKITTSAKMI